LVGDNPNEQGGTQSGEGGAGSNAGGGPDGRRCRGSHGEPLTSVPTPTPVRRQLTDASRSDVRHLWLERLKRAGWLRLPAEHPVRFARSTENSPAPCLLFEVGGGDEFRIARTRAAGWRPWLGHGRRREHADSVDRALEPARDLFAGLLRLLP